MVILSLQSTPDAVLIQVTEEEVVTKTKACDSNEAVTELDGGTGAGTEGATHEKETSDVEVSTKINMC